MHLRHKSLAMKSALQTAIYRFARAFSSIRPKNIGILRNLLASP
jgi:hypothetical protein